MLTDVVDVLLCPQCRVREVDSGLGVGDTDRTLWCDRGHSFDVARQGYVSLLTGDGGKFAGDSAEMIAARDVFLEKGHFDPIAAAVSAGVPVDSEVVLDVGVGTGHYLAAVLDARPEARGIGVDVSKFAARRAARSHPRLGSVVADIWSGLPVRSGALSAVTCVFAPRNAGELNRVLVDDGVLVVVTPTMRHQRELRGPLGLIGVAEDKTRRLGESLSGLFEPVAESALDYSMMLSHNDIEALIGMGPSSRHGDPDARSAALGELPDATEVTASVTVSTYRRANR
ncbi:methyltransferase domain-containing protein [Rhodococcus sp. IEGM 1401]|uniref:methyltransferase domain-containing protein n=1 Tax=unclassified Rhodococcus (in: high G+C Gram-positive bacteria) TaxID=192944 RepID=UPI0022B5CB75|nr:MULTISPECIES: methyltransferase domain-containing protein [unclassified Rhodococcus (in: high G+C Gram-positive bacteria)]MCZ4561986.1 methyltransferase domain-containing protein [Rhodococcus sp. IEGM 1401]MDI9922760.1 methyltransferase domain-containing protein [Rhodococcus sp. IEGM 1372]MDV8034495.1 methyltransferase domain-containing protein [Rhodococcus sp. IEGM 1414]